MPKSRLHKDNPPHVVILVHGIRDFAFWQVDLKAAIEAEGFIVEPTNYGRFDILQFLFPLSFFRDRAVQRVWLQIEQVVHKYPDAVISVIGHSFGTHVVSRILQTKFNFRAHRIIFCGSVVDYEFPFQQFAERFTPDILNDVGSRDIWPALADSVTWGYGSAGTYGFRRPYVTDRWHSRFRHGDFLNSCFATKYWVPFLKHGIIEPGSAADEVPSIWIRLSTIIKIKYVLALLALIVAAILTSRYIYSDYEAEFSSRKNSFFYLQNIGTEYFFDHKLGATCPYSWLPLVNCHDGSVIKLLTGRRYAAFDVDADKFRSIVTCEDAKYQAIDPVALIEDIANKHPACISVSRQKGAPHGRITIASDIPQATNALGKDYLMCGCDSQMITKFKNEGN